MDDNHGERQPRRKHGLLYYAGLVLVILGVIPTLFTGLVVLMTLSAAMGPNPGLHLMGASVGYMFAFIILPLAAISAALLGGGIYCLLRWSRKRKVEEFAEPQAPHTRPEDLRQ